MSGFGKERPFGRYMLSLRTQRKLTQDALAERSGLSGDTVRRLEHGAYSPSLDTLTKLCEGLDIHISTLFYGYELGLDSQPKRELVDLFLAQPPEVQAMALVVLRELFELMDQLPLSEAP